MLVKSPQRPKLDVRMAFVLAWGSQKTRSELGFLPSIVVGGSPQVASRPGAFWMTLGTTCAFHKRRIEVAVTAGGAFRLRLFVSARLPIAQRGVSN